MGVRREWVPLVLISLVLYIFVSVLVFVVLRVRCVGEYVLFVLYREVPPLAC